ncbi:O-methyltransferase [Segniliparus rugosus]|uniref:O-methyltransferase n=1 Tax=Segniliparus rugosus (strain ATCC BAA-974 / DSM 45345 / CCUG 50838 / CIP 108380 / JCM 13579 / CDC 945) TaxID=679197 RepID=E5XN13_SEGRC|nr:class I SAM-dependent methyltransferase [Segniliparus rugosus]EFV14271.1 hypothetical protein HMPREF9336_00883 [Segniliparus rugosus ATCC BAA-974]
MSRLSYYWSLAKSATRKGDTDSANKQALVEHVTANAEPGDVDGVIKLIDEFGSKRAFLMNVGDEKGLLLDGAVARAQPRRLMELGAFCGYSGLRIARAMPPGAHLYSVEISPFNAQTATTIWQHAGVADRITAVVGALGDGKTLGRLRTEFGLGPESLDFLFIDHEHSVYLSDLELLLDAGFLREGAVVVADNVKVPGAPKYLAHMREHEGKDWRTVEHKTHLEYQSFIPDLVLESTYLGAVRG